MQKRRVQEVSQALSSSTRALRFFNVSDFFFDIHDDILAYGENSFHSLHRRDDYIS